MAVATTLTAAASARALRTHRPASTPPPTPTCGVTIGSGNSVRDTPRV